MENRCRGLFWIGELYREVHMQQKAKLFRHLILSQNAKEKIMVLLQLYTTITIGR